jgi:type IV secretion system protein VirB2
MSLADPSGSSAIVGAVLWLQNTLLGTVAVTVAVICVAFVGFMMLSGRVNIRYGLSVIGGCFILFGASSIVAGIQASVAMASPGYASPLPARPAPQVALPPPVTLPPRSDRPSNYDPYAGASLPTR